MDGHRGWPKASHKPAECMDPGQACEQRRPWRKSAQRAVVKAGQACARVEDHSGCLVTEVRGHQVCLHHKRCLACVGFLWKSCHIPAWAINPEMDMDDFDCVLHIAC